MLFFQSFLYKKTTIKAKNTQIFYEFQTLLLIVSIIRLN